MLKRPDESNKLELADQDSEALSPDQIPSMGKENASGEEVFVESRISTEASDMDSAAQTPDEEDCEDEYCDEEYCEDEYCEDEYCEDEDSEDDIDEEELEDDDEEDDEPVSWIDEESKGFIISVLIHVVLIVSLAAVPIVVSSDPLSYMIESPMAPEDESEFKIVDEVAYSESYNEEIGSNSFGDTSMALSQAPVIADVSELSANQTADLLKTPTLAVAANVKQAVGLVEAKKAVRGMTGVGTTGTDGAVDRITYEILHSMEERPTLVVWLFDASGSLTRRRQEIRDRFAHIYEELGIVRKMKEIKEGKSPKPTRAELEEEPLLTSIYSFGAKVDQLTARPTADLDEIMKLIDGIETDSSGIEKTFSAIYLAANEYKSYRVSRNGNGPERNVLFVAVTDERGDDNNGLEKTIEICRKFAMPVYVMGVPAPFGREFSYIKYVDPDPKYDQSAQWAQIDQGPETIAPERVQLGYEDNYFEEPILDSGFGPYALSRLCYETGGIYFTVHPNRKFGARVNRNEIEAFSSHLAYFFNPDIMDRYRPDYTSEAEYLKNAQKSPMRQALLLASRYSRTGVLDKPRTVFVKRDEPSFVNDLTKSQQEAARLEPKLYTLCDMLYEGQKSRDKELSPRWLASFDLSFGTALSEKVRTETYNLMLAKAKRGLPFEKEKNNTWTLKPSSEISVGSKYEKEGKMAREILQRVVDEHSGTPWGLLAQRELERPIGWSWEESYTDLSPPPRPAPAAANNNAAPAPSNEKAVMLQKPPTRPIPKL